MRLALNRVRIKYREIIPFYNPMHTGYTEKENGTIQWLDFTIWMGKLGVILFDIRRRGGRRPYEHRAWKAKKDYLDQRNIPYLVVDRKGSSQEYEMLIRRFIRKERHAT
jgi:hypothetical protein